MNNLLIVYPHWPPSNLAGVHRARLIDNFAHEFNWKVTVLTIHESFYEELQDDGMNLLVHPSIEVIKTNCLPVFRLLGKRLVGDIGLRGWMHLRSQLLNLTKQRQFSFVWIPIPSWYTSLLGAVVSKKRGLPFGIDYIDPWIYKLSQHEPVFSRAWWTRFVASQLEPIAIQHAALITGVSEQYYLPALKRVFGEGKSFPYHVAMPYGFDPADHGMYPVVYDPPWEEDDSRFLIYAGAFLPQSELFMRSLFAGIADLTRNKRWPLDLKVRFVGTGKRPGVSITELALEFNIGNIVEEFSERVPFLQIQMMLRHAFGTLIIGSTEAHYTASKTFQCVLSSRPVFSVLHFESSAVSFLKDANADKFLVEWSPGLSEVEFKQHIKDGLTLLIKDGEKDWSPSLKALEPYSARNSARTLFGAIESVLSLS
jgi:hypothetical protein